MNNFIQPGHVMDFENTDAAAVDITSGSVVAFDERIGVAAVDIAIGEVGSVSVAGVFELPKGNAVLPQGKPVFWKSDKIGTDNTGVPAGYVFDAATAADVTVSVKIG